MEWSTYLIGVTKSSFDAKHQIERYFKETLDVTTVLEFSLYLPGHKFYKLNKLDSITLTDTTRNKFTEYYKLIRVEMEIYICTTMIGLSIFPIEL